MATAATAITVGRWTVPASADPFCLVPVPRWSDPATWGGTVPAAGASVALPATTVVLDVDASVGELYVPQGATLLFDPTTSRTLDASGNVVVDGALTMRPDTAEVVHTLRFVGVNESAFVGGGMSPVASDVGLWITNGGSLDVAGATKTAWARVAGDIAAGAQQIALQQAPTGWRVGDEVAIVPTGPTTLSSHHDRYDVRTVTAVSGANVTLSAPCTYAHPTVDVGDGLVLAAEVLNLTRNVRIEGTSAGRAHVFCRADHAQDVRYVQFRHMGPRKLTGEVTALGPVTANVLGRYPFHMHFMGDAADGSAIVGCVSRDSGGHGFVVHESHGVTLDACIAHDVFDDAFWWDLSPAPGEPPPVSNRVTYSRCVASRVKCDPPFRGYRLAGFALTQGVGSTVTDCVAVGVQGNSNAAGFSWPEGAEGVWGFARNISHNNKIDGLFAWQNGSPVHPITDFACYHNGGAGIDHGAYLTAYQYENGWLYGNGWTSIRLHSQSRDGQLSFKRIRCDAAGRHASPILLEKHNLDGTVPVFMGGLELVGHNGAEITVNNQTGKATRLDVVASGPIDVAWGAVTHPLSVIRVQDGGTAAQITPTGVSPIETFSGYTPAPRVPFPVLAAA